MENEDIFERIDRQWEEIHNKHPLLDEVEVASYWILSKDSIEMAENYARKIEKRRLEEQNQ